MSCSCNREKVSRFLLKFAGQTPSNNTPVYLTDEVKSVASALQISYPIPGKGLIIDSMTVRIADAVAGSSVLAFQLLRNNIQVGSGYTIAYNGGESGTQRAQVSKPIIYQPEDTLELLAVLTGTGLGNLATVMLGARLVD